jgi:hypothetical protein
MRPAVAVLLLALPLGACNYNVYEDPPRAGKVDRQVTARDNCLLAQAPQYDNGGPDVGKVARDMANACAAETEKLLALAVPFADAKARDGFHQEAVRRAATIVLIYRRVDSRLEERRQGEPTPLVK